MLCACRDIVIYIVGSLFLNDKSNMADLLQHLKLHRIMILGTFWFILCCLWSFRITFNLSDHAKQELRKEIKTALQLLILILSYLFAWTPYSVVVILIISGVRETSGILLLVASLFAKASFTYNPVLYAFISKTFRERFIALFCRRLVNNQVLPMWKNSKYTWTRVLSYCSC